MILYLQDSEAHLFNSSATTFERLAPLSSSMPCQSKVSSAFGPLCGHNIKAAMEQYIVHYPLIGLYTMCQLPGDYLYRSGFLAS